jgi:ABC-type phosphate transport system substrate-binding protein
MRALSVTVVALLLASSSPTVSAQQAPSLPYRIIANPKNPVTTVDRRFLNDAFLKKTSRWPNHKVILPADLAANAAPRSRFSEEVINRSVAAVKAYWTQRVFSGQGIPPPEFDSDEKVVAYVLADEGAVGYVSGAANVGASKVLTLTR